LLSFERLFDSEDVQMAKSLTILKENYIELEVEPKKNIKVGSKCIDTKKAIMFEIYHEFSQVIT